MNKGYVCDKTDLGLSRNGFLPADHENIDVLKISMGIAWEIQIHINSHTHTPYVHDMNIIHTHTLHYLTLPFLTLPYLTFYIRLYIT